MSEYEDEHQKERKKKEQISCCKSMLHVQLERK